MNVNHHHKALFFHIPKTGGTAIHLAMSRHERFKHETPETIEREYWEFYLGMHGSFSMLKTDKNTKDEFDTLMSYYKFCYVRNPWSHALSYYFHWIHKDKFLKLDGYQQSLDWKNFKWYLENKYDPQENYTFKDPEFKIDKMFKFEELQDSWDELCDRFNYNRNTLPDVNNSKEHKNIFNFTYPKHYSEWYDNESKEMVEAVSKNEIEKFNYKFTS